MGDDPRTEQAEELAKGGTDELAAGRGGTAEGEDMGPSGTSEDGPLREEDVSEADALDDREK